jgi:hypothetical protein
MTLPLVPEDVSPRARPRPADAIVRAATAACLGFLREQSPEDVAKKAWPRDLDVHTMTRAATSPITTTSASTLVPNMVGDFLASLAPQSAAAQLFQAASRIDLAGVGSVLVPRASTFPAPTFVGEGNAIPVVQGAFANTQVGPTGKLAFIAALTGDLETYAVQAATEIVRIAMTDAASRALDAALFSSTAASSIRPAGILNGATSVTPAPVSDQAMFTDIGNLIGAIADAGGGSNVWLFANARQAVAVTLRSPAPTRAVIPVSTLPAGTVAAVEVSAFASGYRGVPEINVSVAGALHMDTVPSDIGAAGTPNVVAAPSRSLWQTNTLGLRMTVQCAWSMLAPGMVATVAGTNW